MKRESILEAAMKGLKASKTEAKDPVEWLKVLAWQNLRQRGGQIHAGKERFPEKFKKANVDSELNRIATVIDKATSDLDKVIKKIFSARV